MATDESFDIPERSVRERPLGAPDAYERTTTRERITAQPSGMSFSSVKSTSFDRPPPATPLQAPPPPPPPAAQRGWLARMQDSMLEQSGKMWFPVFVAFLYFLDTFVLVMPNDVFIVAAVAANKKRWFVVTLLLTAACAISCVSVYLIAMYDPDWLRRQFPSVFASSGWKQAEDVFEEYGVVASFLLVTVLPIHPFLLVGALARVPMFTLVASITAGRFIRNTIVCYGTAFLGDRGIKGAIESLWRGGKKD